MLKYSLRKKIVLLKPKRKAVVKKMALASVWLLLLVAAVYMLVSQIKDFDIRGLLTIPIIMIFLLFLLYMLVALFSEKDKPVGKEKEDPLLEDVGRFVVKNQVLSSAAIRREFLVNYAHSAYLIDKLKEIGVVKNGNDRIPQLLVHSESVFNELLRRYRKKKVLRKLLGCIIVMALMGFASCDNNSNDPVEALKRRIDMAEMIEYVDSTHDARLRYPDFFLVDTTGEYSAVRFYYSDENVKNLSLCLDYYPPRLFQNIDKVVDIFQDSLYVCVEKRRTYCIMKGKDGPNSEFIRFSKCKRGGYWWVECTLIYEPQYEGAVKRLTKMVKDWKPIPSQNIPEWLSDLCDSLEDLFS